MALKPAVFIAYHENEIFKTVNMHVFKNYCVLIREI